MADLFPYVTHGVINVALSEVAPGPSSTIGNTLSGRVAEFATGEIAPRAIEWLEAMPVDSTLPEQFYRPKLFSTWGSFDLAAVFLSPDLSLPNYMGRALAVHQLQRAVIVAPQGADASASFLEGMRADATWPFMAFTKLKINPAVTYADDALHESRLAEALRIVNSLCGTWCGGRSHSERATCVGVGLGWSELNVVAVADDLDSLCDLVRRLRGVSTLRDRGRHSLFVTTVTKLGYSHQIVHEVERALDTYAAARSHASERMDASCLVSIAEDVGRRVRTDGAHRAASMQMLPGFSVYPGGEAVVLAQLAQAKEAVPASLERSIAFAPPQFEMGNRDVLGPALRPGLEFGDVQCAAYLHALQIWLLRGGSSTGSGSLYFTTRTAIQFLGGGGSGEEIQLGEIRPAWLNEVSTHLNGIEDRLRATMQLLQVPYARTEQVLNLVSTLWWAHNRSVVWEEVVQLIPVLLCVAAYLERVCDTWQRERKRVVRRSRRGRLGDGNVPAISETTQRAHESLRRIIREFRSTFYNRHLSGYLTDDTPDINLRYRGSIQQLLNISNLILDAMVEVVFGSRACLATIGDTTAPEVHSPCDVVIANLHSETLRSPVLLEILGHEVGHQFVVDIMCEVNGVTQSHPWNRDPALAEQFRDVCEAFGELQAHVYLDATEVDDHFIEATADFIEYLLIGGPFDGWVRSYLLRSVLVSDPVAYPDSTNGADESAGQVPVTDPRIVLSSMIRVCHVGVFEQLSHRDGSLRLEDLNEFKIEMADGVLKRVRGILGQCIVGPSGELVDLVNTEERWREFIKYHVFVAAWLETCDTANHALEWVRSIATLVNARRSIGMWPEVNRRILSLRNAFLDEFTPALHVRHWISWRHVKKTTKPVDLRDSWEGVLPWLVAGPPAIALDDPKSREQIKAILLQRGRAVPTTSAGAERVNVAHARFVYEMLEMVPEWRRSLVIRANRIEALRVKDASRRVASSPASSGTHASTANSHRTGEPTL